MWNPRQIQPVVASIRKIAFPVFMLMLIMAVPRLMWAQSETVLYTFCSIPPQCADGAFPLGSLVRDSKGNLFSTTYFGGSFGVGVAFKVNPVSGETVLYNFSGGSDGGYPFAGLVRGPNGKLYGTSTGGGNPGCNSGGELGCGTVFSLSSTGKQKVLYRFSDLPDGNHPFRTVIFDAQGNLYGTTTLGGNPKCWNGGSFGCGTVFKLSPDGTETILHEFGAYDGDGKIPNTQLVMDSQGNLYGTTRYGGHGTGTVFKVSATGVETILYAFKASGPRLANGNTPTGLILDKAGNLIGTTTQGGIVNSNCPNTGCGVVFKLAPDGTFKVLYSFTGGSDGATPEASVIADSRGNLYGTTNRGGSSSGGIGGVCADAVPAGCGMVFKLDPTGAETVLHTFTGGADGALPEAGLLRDAHGNLYGTTVYGGNSACQFGCGVLFKISP